MMSLEFAFWASILGLSYIFVGYPAVVWGLARFFCYAPVKRPSNAPLSVVIVAHNEAANLERKLRGIFASDCEPQIREVIVALDGSTDESAARIRAHPDPRVRLLSWESRRGKSAVLNEVIPQCVADVIVLTD